MKDENGRPMIIFGKKEKKVITLFGLFMLFVLMIFYKADFSAESEMFVINKAETLWELKSLQNGEQYIKNAETGDKIYKAFTHNEDGKFVEIPLDEYIIFKNTTPTLGGESGVNNDFEKCRDSLFVDYKEKAVEIVFGEPEIYSSYLTGIGSISVGGHTFDIPENMTCNVNFVPSLMLTTRQKELRILGIGSGEVSECVYQFEYDGHYKGIFELCIELSTEL